MPTISPFGLDGNNNTKSLSPFDIKGKGWTKIFSPFDILYAVHAPLKYMLNSLIELPLYMLRCTETIHAPPEHKQGMQKHDSIHTSPMTFLSPMTHTYIHLPTKWDIPNLTHTPNQVGIYQLFIHDKKKKYYIIHPIVGLQIRSFHDLDIK